MYVPEVVQTLRSWAIGYDLNTEACTCFCSTYYCCLATVSYVGQLDGNTIVEATLLRFAQKFCFLECFLAVMYTRVHVPCSVGYKCTMALGC